MTPPCRLTTNAIYRENARHSARFYALRAASGADGSRPIPTPLPKKGCFDKPGTHSCVPCGLPGRSIYRDGCNGRHICRPYRVPVMSLQPQNRGRGLPRPYRAINKNRPPLRGADFCYFCILLSHRTASLVPKVCSTCTSTTSSAVATNSSTTLKR